MLTIEYIDDTTGECLALIEKKGVVETLIPSYNASQHQVFINKHFSGNPGMLLWQVVNVESCNGHVKVSIKAEQGSPISFGTYAQTQGIKSLSSLLKKYQIIDVDFGYRSDCFSSKGQSDNRSFSCSILPGELHKKRPCLILGMSNKWRTLQVIPLSTKDPSGDKRCVPLPTSTFSTCAYHYRANPSFALLDMLQTISWYRAYPLRAVDSRFMEHDRRIYLPEAKRREIESLLSSGYQPSHKAELKLLEDRIKKLETERAKIIPANARLCLDLAEVRSFNIRNEDILRRIATEMFDIKENTPIDTIRLTLDELLN